MKPTCIEEKDFKYLLPPDKTLIQKKRKIEAFVSLCKEKTGLEDYTIEIDYLLLCKVIVRVDKRADYFQYFHSDDETMHMSQDKEAALLAYWIVKYKPFRLKNVSQEEEFYRNFKCSINEFLAAFMLVFYLYSLDNRLQEYFSPTKINVLIYDLMNRNISKSAMIMYVESFVPAITGG